METERLIYEAQGAVKAIEEDSRKKHQHLEEKMAKALEKN
jgi:hypothetical protein